MSTVHLILQGKGGVGKSLPAFTDELFPQVIASMLKSRLTLGSRCSFPPLRNATLAVYCAYPEVAFFASSNQDGEQAFSS